MELLVNKEIVLIPNSLVVFPSLYIFLWLAMFCAIRLCTGIDSEPPSSIQEVDEEGTGQRFNKTQWTWKWSLCSEAAADTLGIFAIT